MVEANTLLCFYYSFFNPGFVFNLIFLHLPPRLKRLMCVAWHRDPDSRPTFREVLEALRAEEAALA